MNYTYSRCYCLPLNLEPGLYITGVAISSQAQYENTFTICKFTIPPKEKQELQKVWLNENSK